jgi:hypothetical protein
MFYLIEFFKSLGESLARGFFFFFLSCLLAFGLTHRQWISQSIEKISPEKIINPYFVAVMDENVDSDKLKALTAKLPGVLSIEDKNTEENRHKLTQLISQLGSDYRLSSELVNFQSLRISLNPSLSAESLSFVRDQVVKFGGKNHITATDVKYPEVTNVIKSHPFYTFLARFGDWGVICFLAFFWVISFWLNYDIFRSRSYIIEKFQRRTFVAAKTLAGGLFLVIILFSGLGLLNGTLKILDLIVLLMIFSVCWTFTMQDWKWKPRL